MARHPLVVRDQLLVLLRVFQFVLVLQGSENLLHTLLLLQVAVNSLFLLVFLFVFLPFVIRFLFFVLLVCLTRIQPKRRTASVEPE